MLSVLNLHQDYTSLQTLGLLALQQGITRQRTILNGRSREGEIFHPIMPTWDWPYGSSADGLKPKKGCSALWKWNQIKLKP
jgi:hypothetical protein